MDYAELASRLREDATWTVSPTCDDLKEAADAIEELQKNQCTEDAVEWAIKSMEVSVMDSEHIFFRNRQYVSLKRVGEIMDEMWTGNKAQRCPFYFYEKDGADDVSSCAKYGCAVKEIPEQSHSVWISAAIDPPSEGTYLVCNAHNQEDRAGDGFFGMDKKWRCTVLPFHLSDVTHWMMYPLPPKGDET